MRKLQKLILTLLLVSTASFSLMAQNGFFHDAGANTMVQSSGMRTITPQNYRASSLNVQGLKNFLASLPAEQRLANKKLAPVLELPMPNGQMAKFRVWESSIMEPGLSAKFPEIRTYAGQGIDDPYASIRFDFNPYFGFHAAILTVNGDVYIDPYAKYDVNNYMSYYISDNKRHEDFFVCNTPQGTSAPQNIEVGPCRGTQLYAYRLALACTGEYAIAVCSPSTATVPLTMAAMVTSVNRVDGVYESELAVRMTLVANDNLLVYLDPNTDPYTNNNGTVMLTQNQNNIDALIGAANYDFGHVFSTGGGGIAGLGVICRNGLKAEGVTGLPNPVGDNFDIDYVAHEMGHEFGANHPFNSSMSNCGGGNRNASTAYEVGSGTSIMGYAGICGTDDIQPHSDPFFHTISFDEISTYISGTGGGCAVMTPTSNSIPVITAMNNNGANIPLNTPFTLTGSATDPDGDPVTYCWEEWDLGPTTVWNGGNANTTSPLFKSRIPKTTGSRTFPDISVILAGYPVNPANAMGGLKGETLPTQARAMKFRLTVRDNRAAGGGVATGGSGCNAGFTGVFQVNTIAGTGPFIVSAPNGGETWSGGSTQTITWNPAGTDQAPISCTNVKISLSTDGGLTYPTVITSSTPNDGSEALTIPSITTSTARIKVEAIGNIFFDISDNNFNISVPQPGFTFTTPAPAVASCPAPASMGITLPTSSVAGFVNPITLSASGNPAGTTVTFGTNPVTPGSSSLVTLNSTNTLANGSYVIIVTGTAASAPNQNVNLTYTINAGSAPSITGQPSPQTVCSGSSASFTVTATGATSYQWQLSTDGGTTYNNVGGATSATYNISNVQASNAGLYHCIIIGQCNTAISNAALLTVNTAPSISSQPQSVTLCAGSNNTFSVTAAGTAITYQWQLSVDGGATFNNIAGATSSSYALTAITVGMNGNQYRVIVTGSCTPAVTSTAATLTVVTAVTITQQPGNATVCNLGNTSFTVGGSGTGIIYQWQLSTDGGATYSTLGNGGVYSGANTATLQITGATLVMSGYKYRAMLSNATCTSPGISTAATLTVNAPPAVSSNPLGVTVCAGSVATFSVAGTGAGLTYQWQVSFDNGVTFSNITNGGVYSGATTNTLTITGPASGMNNFQYRAIISGTCSPAATSTAAILTVISPVSISAQPVNAEICSGSNTSFSVTASSAQTIIYQWQVSTDNGVTYTNVSNGGVYSGATTSLLTITGGTAAMNSYKYRAQLASASCSAPVSSNAATITVHQLPSVGLTAAPLTSLLPGQSTTLTATPSASTGGTLSTTWYINGSLFSNTGNTKIVHVDSVGSYQVKIQEAWPSALVCANQSAIVVIDATASSKLFIYPNPTDPSNDGQFTVSYYNNGGAVTTRSISIFDSKGSRVFNKQFSVTGLYTLIKIDLRPAQTGIYYVVVGDNLGKKLAEGKVVVH